MGGGLFRVPALADHWLRSELVDAAVPLDWDPFESTVDTDELDEFELIEEDELLRDRGLRGANIPLTSSGFIGTLPLLVPHAGRDICGKFGGLATAVMREGSRKAW